MNLDIENLPEDGSALKEIIVKLNSQYQEKVHHLEEYIRLLKNEIFGRKSEKAVAAVEDQQMRLFNEASAKAYRLRPKKKHTS